MVHKLGMHWMRVHPDGEDLAHVARMRYRSLKLFEWMWSDKNFCTALIPTIAPDALILARDHPLSEQKADAMRAPEETGRRHADEWAAKVQGGKYHLPTDRTRFLSINEPDATNGDRRAIDINNVAFLDRLRYHNLRGGAFNFSTGQPRTVDGTPNTLADYGIFEGSHQAIVRGGHIGVLHIYGTAAVPCAPGHFDRLRACPWQDVTWVVGECGIDEHVIGGGPHDGYQVPYAGQLNNYVGWLDALILGVNDPRIHSWQPFTYDFSKPWDTFNIRDIREALETYEWWHALAPTPTPPPPAPPPTVINLPIVVGPGAPMPTPPPPAPPAPPPAPPQELPSGIIDPLVLQAILLIESGGEGFAPDGRVKIRFEAHIFKAELHNDLEFYKHFRYGNPAWTGQEILSDGFWQPIHTGAQTNEWLAYNRARSINPIAAARSISMGAAQIMGFNHTRIGYPSALAMLQAFSNVNMQVIGFINFLLSDAALWLAVRTHDWREIARRYNGAGAVDTYAPLLERKYRELQGD